MCRLALLLFCISVTGMVAGALVVTTEVVTEPTAELTMVGGSNYVCHNEESWNGALSTSNNDSSLLVYANDETDVTRILLYLGNNKNCGNPSSIHVGISDIEEKGVWKTVDGKPLDEVYHKWNVGYPQIGKGHCVGMEITGNNHNGLFNYDCTSIKKSFLSKRL